MTTPGAVPHPRDLLAAAQHDTAERDRLVARRAAAESALRGAREAAERARAKHALEAADVDRLESMSPTRIWAALRGDHAERLDRERGEEQAARYAVALAQAQAAATRADASLRAAYLELRSADGWATYDTFFGGGMVADLVKRSRMDKASDLMRRADAELRTLRTELGDLGRTGVGELGIGSLTRTLDFWFDNMFSDWSVKNRIQEAGGRVEAARRQVQAVRAGLASHAAELEERSGLLESRREEMLRSA